MPTDMGYASVNQYIFQRTDSFFRRRALIFNINNTHLKHTHRKQTKLYPLFTFYVIFMKKHVIIRLHHFNMLFYIKQQK